MIIVECTSRMSKEIEIIPVEQVDYNFITKSKFWFNWKEEKTFKVYKLCLKKSDCILGLISLEVFPEESRIEIRLLAVSKENRGMGKKYDCIAGNLIAFAGIEAIKMFGEMACISLIPKTELIRHYMDEYGFMIAMKSLYLEGTKLLELIKKYDHD